MYKRTITGTISLLLALTAFAQQSNVNLSYNPQKDTEGLIPFSANLNSPQVNDDHTVVFRLRAPKAESVALSGAMTTVLGVRGNIPFTKGEDGIWTLTIGPLPVDMYQYNLVVDGVSMADPNNTYAAFTAMPPYSELIVHGDGPSWWDAKDVPHGAVTRHIYYSPVTQGQREIYVYTPPQYNPKKKYPVLYLMGGSGELPSNWMYDDRLRVIFSPREPLFRRIILIFAFMKRKQRFCLAACIALLMAALSCNKENNDTPAPGKPSQENGFNVGFGYVGGYASENQRFEEDWASMKEISLVTKHYFENEKEITESIKVPLPWAWDQGPQQWLPRYTARNMAEIDGKDWEMAFNLTGIKEKPGEHYFGLYNRHTGILRIFYYLTEDRVPSHDGNDHMWNLGMTKDLIERRSGASLDWRNHSFWSEECPATRSITTLMPRACASRTSSTRSELVPKRLSTR